MTDLFKRAGAFLIAAVVLAVLAAWSLSSPPSASNESPPATPPGGNAGTVRVAGAAPVAPPTPTWEVTVTDATGINLDAARLFDLGFAGGVVINRDTRAAIEALMNSMPEHPSEQELQRLDRTLREGLTKEDADAAVKLVNDYRAYTDDVRREIQPLGIPKDLPEVNALFDQMEALKRKHFDEATAKALFGPDDAYARVSMEASFVQQDMTLTIEQRAQRLDELRARLPEDKKSMIPPSAMSDYVQPKS